MYLPNPTAVPAAPGIAPSASARRILLSSFIGSLVEWYDFLLYGTAAALVFGQLFFSGLSPTAGTIAAFATLAVGYLSRPIGGIVGGHYGDTLGRKKVLVVCILVMGVGTAAIGLLPTSAHVGFWAPVLLVLLRTVQGVALGGEWGGSILITLEHADDRHRGLWTSVAQAGAPAGLLLSTVVLWGATQMPENSFLAWGWRIPFIVTLVLAGVGLWIRVGVAESPLLEQAERTAGLAGRPPLLTLLRRQPRGAVLSVVLVFGPLAANSILVAFCVSYASQIGFDQSTTLLALCIGAVCSMAVTPLAAAFSDRVGRRPVYITGAVLLGINSFLLFPMMHTKSPALLFLGFGLGLGTHAFMNGPMGAIVSEIFETRTRYTGASIGYQVGSVVGGGLGPLIAASLLVLAGGPPHAILVSVFMALACATTATAVLLLPESHRTDLSAPAGDPGVAA